MNTFALALIGISKPDLLDAGCAAISHDANWMDAVYHRLPVTSNIDIIRYLYYRRLLYKTPSRTHLKDIIYPDRTWDPDRALLEQALLLAHENQDNLIPTFVEFREPNSPPRFVFVRVWVVGSGDIDVHSASRGGGSSNAATVDTTAVLPRL
ncbi:hypothetical protein V5O48_010114 [Marasmius crinis-equi]|uniref:Uncharacterized protein n=1 Tax=Marasmius crinis-equi TaxID=585013 RepID=A0ABR3F976_9AGAR